MDFSQAKEIAENGQKFVQENLMSEDIFCYHVLLFEVRITIRVFYPYVIMHISFNMRDGFGNQPLTFSCTCN